MLPTTRRWPEMLPTSTRMRKMRETRKQKEVKKAKMERVRVACLRLVAEESRVEGLAFSEFREAVEGEAF